MLLCLHWLKNFSPFVPQGAQMIFRHVIFTAPLSLAAMLV